MEYLYPQIKFDIMNKYTKKLLDTQLTFDVALRDINDNAPEFQSNQITAYVKESWTGGECLVLEITYRVCKFSA